MKFPQQATFWNFKGYDGFGLPTFSQPAVLFARWENRMELFYNHYGEEMKSKSVIYVADLPTVESYVMLGVSTNTDPLVIPDAYKICAISIIGNLSNTRRVIKAWT